GGKFGMEELLATGATVLVDDGYMRESILLPQTKLVSGYQPIMPTFQGQVSEDDLIRLLSYVKSIPAPGAQTQQVESAQSQIQSSGAPAGPPATTTTNP
ncbi:MAG: cytochrome c oxidase subunit II, partial [Thermoanaerobaculia bacterium]